MGAKTEFRSKAQKNYVKIKIAGEKFNGFWLFQGVEFKTVTLLSIPYITRMDPKVPGKDSYSDDYEMDGLFAEVWFGLQVRI